MYSREELEVLGGGGGRCICWWGLVWGGSMCVYVGRVEWGGALGTEA